MKFLHHIIHVEAINVPKLHVCSIIREGMKNGIYLFVYYKESGLTYLTVEETQSFETLDVCSVRKVAVHHPGKKWSFTSSTTSAGKEGTFDSFITSIFVLSSTPCIPQPM